MALDAVSAFNGKRWNSGKYDKQGIRYFLEIKERIHYVLDKTEAATNTTLEHIEAGTQLLTRIESLAQSRESNNTNTVDEALLNDIGKLANESKGHLAEITCAQEYQDLCAQVLEFALTSLTDIEQKISQGDGAIEALQQDSTPNEGDALQGVGPQVGEQDTAIGQDDVDDLLDKYSVQ